MCDPLHSALLNQNEEKHQELHAPVEQEQQKTQQMGSGGPQPEMDTEEARLLHLKTNLTENEREEMERCAKPKMDFQALSAEQLAGMKKGERKAYQKKVAAYQERVRQWETDGVIQGEISDLRQTIARRQDYAERQLEIWREGKKFPTLEAEPDAMDEALRYQAAHQDEINALRDKELDSWSYSTRKTSLAQEAVERYMQNTRACNLMNESLREGIQNTLYANYARDAVKGLAEHKLSHDTVVRRGAGLVNMAGMLGMKNPEWADSDTIKQTLNAQMEKGECVITDKGLVSTSSLPNCGYGGAVEYIILVRRGTSAIDMSGIGRKEEHELVVNANTKFRVIKAFFNDGTPGSQRASTKTTGMKIYLETIPQKADEGEEA